LLGNHTEVERLRGKITGLEQVVADMKTLQAKGSQGQRELEMQLQGAQESISSLTKEVISSALESSKQPTRAECSLCGIKEIRRTSTSSSSTVVALLKKHLP
jgi:hypothetical protein